MARRKDIEFLAADGLLLRGWLYSTSSKNACIIMSNGLSGSKEHFLDDFGLRFQTAGYTVLIYDNRNWGASEGLPRNETDPALQVRDYLAAFDYAASLPEVDLTKIVYWGSSVAGGNAICAAGLDNRIRAVIAQVPFVSGEMDRAQLAKGLSTMLVPVIPQSIEEAESGTSQAILNTPDLWPFLAELDRRNVVYEKSITLQTIFYLQGHLPEAFIHRITPTPLLMVVGEKDLCVPTSAQLAMFEKAKEPKTLHIVQGAGHFDVYHGQGFEDNIDAQLRFLSVNLS